jgi:hypothetical protein
MDVEEGATAAGRKDQDKVLVRDDNYTITERKVLPVEVQQAVAGSGAPSSSSSLKEVKLIFRSM